MSRKVITITLNASNTVVTEDSSKATVSVNPESGIQEATVRPTVTFVNSPAPVTDDIDGGTF